MLAALATPSIARAQGERISVRLDFSPWGVQAAMHLAETRGWFREAGLTVDVQDGRGSGNTLQLVNAGQADVGQIQIQKSKIQMLSVTDLEVCYGSISALRGISFNIPQG
eukprot:gene47245-57866_t